MPRLNPEETVCYISREKSDAAARLCAADDIIITADTMVFLDDKRLGKPHGEEEALAMLTALAGRHHTVCTGVTVRRGETVLTRAQATDVYFRPASQAELRAYIRGGAPRMHGWVGSHFLVFTLGCSSSGSTGTSLTSWACPSCC